MKKKTKNRPLIKEMPRHSVTLVLCMATGGEWNKTIQKLSTGIAKQLSKEMPRHRLLLFCYIYLYLLK